MEFRLLGPLEVADGDRILHLGGPKQRTLLAHLLLRANEVVTVERLVDGLWGDAPPETARNTIQTYVRHLRKILGPATIEQRSGGYVIAAPDEQVDAIRFAGLVAEARAAAETDHSLAAAILQDALALWRGPALDDLAEQGSLRSEIARLEELRLVAVEDRIAAEISLGRDRELVSELETLVARHPFREQLWAHLMSVLYRSGRQGDALNAYQRARTVLAEELGIDPSPDLQRLHDRILRQDEALAVTGQPLRGYRLLEQVGAGHNSVVHRAYQPQVGREVAVKVIDPLFANDPAFIRSFEADAQHVARLEHPHIVPLYDFWREPDGAYLVMRYLRGGSLQETLGARTLGSDEAVRLVEQIARALDAAHRRGVIHRDVKPTNILFDEDGNAYLSDFGIARDVDVDASQRHHARSDTHYWAPEEIRGDAPSPRSDVYSLGLVMLEALGGRRSSIQSPASLRPDLPPDVDAVIARATHVDPDQRYPDAPSFAAALASALARTVPAAIRTTEILNPYKGLRPFGEPDAADFFGRDALVERLLTRMRETGPNSGMLAVVGPSGSGKSSVVRAGLVPALRKGALPGSEGWFIVEMHPGMHPFEELAAALVGVAVDAPRDLASRIETEQLRLEDAAAAMLPAGEDLVLVVDQFEEIFTLVDDERIRGRFLDVLHDASAPGSRVRVVVTLRADFYDRPLLYEPFGASLAARTEAVTPLFAEELERAISGPLGQVGVAADPSLVAEIVAAVRAEPGGLPLFQYALTELFEHRRDHRLTIDAYRAIGGVAGALARTAEELFTRLDERGQVAARQLFLRLVTVGEDGAADTRRRVPRAELTTLDVDAASMEAVIDTFGTRRLLSFDRDPTTRGPTVEVAHEALLREWGRLRGWIDASRDQLLAHRRLSTAAHEWVTSDRDEGFLLRGPALGRLAEFADSSGLALSIDERAFLDASLAARDAELAAEESRRAREIALERRSVIRLRALVAVLAVAVLVTSGLSFVAVGQRGTARRESRIATARELAAAASANVRADPERSILLALRAVEVSRDAGGVLPEAMQALHDALAVDRLLFTLEHPSTANVEWSPDGRLIATGGTAAGRDQTDVVLWDAATGEQVRVLSGHSADIGDLSFSADSTRIATHGESKDGRMIVWDTRTGKQVYSIPLGHPAGNSSYSPDGRRIVVGRRNAVSILDASNGRVIDRLPAGPAACAPSIYSPDATKIAVAEHESVTIFDVRTRRELLSIDFDGACGMVFSPDGTTLATSRTDSGGVSVWDAQSGDRRLILTGTDPIGLDQSADGSLLATGESDGTARIWDAVTGRELMALAGHSGGVGLVSFSPDGTRLVTGGSDGTARVWDITPAATAEVFGSFDPPAGWSIAYSPDGRFLATTGFDSGWLRDAATGQRVAGLAAGGDVAFSGDGSTMALTRLDFPPDRTVHLLTETATGKIVTRTKGLDGFRFRSAYHSSSALIATAGSGVTVLSAASGKKIRSISARESMNGVAISPDGSLLAGLSMYATLFLWDSDTGEEVRRIQAHSGFGEDVVFSPAGSQIATVGADGAAVWSLDGTRLTSMTGAGRLSSVAFSPSGEWLATGGNDAVHVWDVTTGDQVLALRGHDELMNAVAFSPDGTRLATISESGTVRVYALALDELVEIARARLTRGFTEQECRRYLRLSACPRSEPTGPGAPPQRSQRPAGPEGAYWIELTPADLTARSFTDDDRDTLAGGYAMSLTEGRFRLDMPHRHGDLREAWWGTYTLSGDRIAVTFEYSLRARCLGTTMSARWTLRGDGVLRFTDISWPARKACGPQRVNDAWARAIFGSKPWARIT